MELSVLNIAGQETGRKIVLDDAIFGIQPNEHAIYLDGPTTVRVLTSQNSGMKFPEVPKS